MFKKMITLCFLFFGSGVFADTLQNEIDQAAIIIREFRAMPETSIPSEILRNAQGLAILSVIKGGFIFSGRIGSGIVIARTEKGWSAPSAIGVGGAGFGFQIGGEITDFVMVLNTQAAVDAFAIGESVTLGGNVSVAAGPIGRTAEASVVFPPAAVYSYSRSKGLFAGASLEGTVVIERSSVNRRFYQKPVTSRELLYGEIPPPKSGEALYQALDHL